MNRTIIPLDTGYYSQTYVDSEDVYAGVDFHWNSFFFESLFTHLIPEGYLDSTDICTKIKLDTVQLGPEDEEISASIQINPELRAQILHSPKKRKWDKKKLYRQMVFLGGRNKGPRYTCSNPYFFKNNEAAVIYVSVFYRPLMAQGYIEYYEKDRHNRWHLISIRMVWMS
ncbi:MAG: hypothetical protein AAGI38_11855 [Bacteroidota bacterium]